MSGNVFLAIDPTDDERHALAAALTEASPGPRIPGRQVRPENWHITVRFIGELDDVQMDRLVEEIDDRLGTPAGHVVGRELGAFPKPSKATVVHVALTDEEAVLDRLAGECEDACRSIGLEPEGRPFVPHLTLARIRPAVDVRRLFQTFSEFVVPISVDTVTLMRTINDDRGVRYERCERFHLGAGRR